MQTTLHDHVRDRVWWGIWCGGVLGLGLRKLVLGLRLLEGRCVNAKEAKNLNVPFGSRPQTLIIEGLSMLEGNPTPNPTTNGLQ